MSDRPTLRTAVGVARILEAIARATWAKAHDKGESWARSTRECPDNRMPTSEEDLAARLSECSEAVRCAVDAIVSCIRGVLDEVLSGPAPKVHSERRVRLERLDVAWDLLEASHVLQDVTLSSWVSPTSWWLPSVDHLHAVWLLARRYDSTLTHPLAPLVAVWQQWREAQGDPPNSVHLIVKREKRPPTRAEPLTLARSPGLLALFNTPLEAVEVDGEPLVTAAPSGSLRRRYRVGDPEGKLWPAPRRLSGLVTAGGLIEIASSVPLSGDERSPLRADLIRIGTLAYALSRPMRLTTGELSHLVTKQDTPWGREQGLRLARAMRGASVMVGGEPWLAFDAAKVGDTHRIAAPRWWLDAVAQGRLDVSVRGPIAFRLTGVLFRRIPGGRKAARWGTLERTVAGIEGALLWGSSAGGGRRGRLPDAVRPVRRGGPGAEVIIPWYQLLRLSGEHVTPAMLADKEKRATLNRRFNRRIEDLITAGYHCGTHGEPAPANDTVEIVQRIKGGRHHEAAIKVRATARFCAAYAHGGERTELPASHLFAS